MLHLGFEIETIIILINYLEKFRNHPKKNDCDQSINCGKKIKYILESSIYK